MSDQTPIRVTYQGSPKVGHDYAYEVRRGDDVVSFFIDMESKYCEVCGWGGGGEDDVPDVCIGATEHSMYLDDSEERDKLTNISFPEFAGWDVHCATVSKWTVAVCLTRWRTPPLTANEVADG